MEQSIPPYTRLRERLVSVDEIEAATGIDFFYGIIDGDRDGFRGGGGHSVMAGRWSLGLVLMEKRESQIDL
jgi:hypothetical protein